MIIGKSKKDLEKMRAAGRLAAQVREAMRGMARAGVTTLDLDAAAERMIRDAGALPTFKGYHGYPYSICASVNEQIVHGFPSEYALKDGDILSVDVGATLGGWVGDTATTIPVGEVSEELRKLVAVTEECLARAIRQCWPGKHLGDIGWAVQEYAEGHGYSVVREYVGHGIGRKMHEDPQVPNYGKPGTGARLRAGYVFAIEPMVNIGTHHTRTLKDGWTVVTVDGKPSAHVEHTVAITEEGPEVLTSLGSAAAEPERREAAAVSEV
jgi:methionyl aminopeptidase